MSNIKENTLQISNLESPLFLEDGKIFGWAFVKNEDSKYSDIYLEITYKDEQKKIVSVSRIDRQDVADYFKNNLYIHSGFYTHLPNINEKIKMIRVIIKNNSNVTVSELYTIFKAKNLINKINPFR